MGCDIAASTAFEALGISVDMPPAVAITTPPPTSHVTVAIAKQHLHTCRLLLQVVLDPSMTVTRAALAAAFPSPASVHVSSGSTLVVSGSGVVVKDLTLDGALVVTVDSGSSYGMAACREVGDWLSYCYAPPPLHSCGQGECEERRLEEGVAK